jgi:hypothetical protein
MAAPSESVIVSIKSPVSGISESVLVEVSYPWANDTLNSPFPVSSGPMTSHAATSSPNNKILFIIMHIVCSRDIADEANIESGQKNLFKKKKKDFFLFLNACFSFFEALFQFLC